MTESKGTKSVLEDVDDDIQTLLKFSQNPSRPSSSGEEASNLFEHCSSQLFPSNGREETWVILSRKLSVRYHSGRSMKLNAGILILAHMVYL